MVPAEPVGGGRSAFAAAVFSALLPGAGQAYLGRWGRALAWVAPYLLIGALVAGLLFNPETRRDLLAQFSAPSWLLGTIGLIVLDGLYRIASVVDVWRLGAPERERRRGGILRLGSVAGVGAVLLVLVVSHVALARPVYLAYDALSGIGGGDETPIGSPPPFESPGPLPSGFPIPSGSPSAPGSEAPTVTPGTATPAPATPGGPTPTPTPNLPWNGTERLNVLLIGADRREDGSSYLTDTMIVVTIDPTTKQVGMISLPRDTTRVPLPRQWAAHDYYGGVFPHKINTLYTYARSVTPGVFPGNDAQRGYLALKGALSELYQLDIKYYVAVDLTGFTRAIDALGGVIIDVQVPVDDSHYPTEDGRGSLKLHIPAGIQYMDGAEALSYARARHETSDFDRTERQQRVITSVREQTDLGEILGQLPVLLDTFKQNVKTDVPPELFPRLVSLLQEVDLNDRVSLQLTPPTYSTQCYPCPGTGLYELRANAPAIRRAVAQIFTRSPDEIERMERLAAEGAVVHVLNGTTANNGPTVSVAEYLASVGVDATVPPVAGGRADATTYTATVIRAYGGVETDMPETVALLEETFGVSVEPATGTDVGADFQVIVGTETPPLRPET